MAVHAVRQKKRERVGQNLYRRTNDGRYEDIRTNPATGKQQLQTLKARTLTDARKEQRALAVSIDRGETVAPSRTSVAAVATDYFEAAGHRVVNAEMAERSRALYLQRWNTHLSKRIGRMKAQNVQAKDITAVLRELREAGLSSHTVSGVLAAASAIFNHAVARGPDL
jgi:hypothetical protein